MQPRGSSGPCSHKHTRVTTQSPLGVGPLKQVHVQTVDALGGSGITARRAAEKLTLPGQCAIHTARAERDRRGRGCRDLAVLKKTRVAQHVCVLVIQAVTQIW